MKAKTLLAGAVVDKVRFLPTLKAEAVAKDLETFLPQADRAGRVSVPGLGPWRVTELPSGFLAVYRELNAEEGAGVEAHEQFDAVYLVADLVSPKM